MKLFLVFAVLATLAVICSIEAKPADEWEDYKKSFNKSYKSPEDEQEHKNAYTERVKSINEHNKRYEAGKETYQMGINQFTDQTEAERKNGGCLQTDHKKGFVAC